VVVVLGPVVVAFGWVVPPLLWVVPPPLLLLPPPPQLAKRITEKIRKIATKSSLFGPIDAEFLKDILLFLVSTVSVLGTAIAQRHAWQSDSEE
jgi:hypothetical protein